MLTEGFPMPSETSSVELVAELHRRQGEMYAGGSIDSVVELLAGDIVWHVPGRSPIAGDHRGVEQVIAYFELRRELADATMRMHPGPPVHQGDAVAQFVKGTARLDGQPVSWQTIGVYRIDVEQRQIREVWLVPLDSELFDRIWSGDGQSKADAARGHRDNIVVVREGEGPEVLLVHGGASPATTWSGLESLKSRWTLATAYRRGFPPSAPPPEGRQDFDVDATDIERLLDRRPHVVAHSYGALGALIAATRRPAQVRSLTLIEPPLFYLVPDDPELARFQRMGDEALALGLDTEPATLREFLRIAGSPVPDTGPLPENVVQAVRRAHGSRSPSEARPALDVLRDADIPALVSSGDHASFLERAADALADELSAERLVAPGAGHFVAAAPGFGERLERFLISVS